MSSRLARLMERVWRKHKVDPAPDVEGEETNLETLSRLTTDRSDPRLTHGIDTEPRDQADAYLVLSEEERAKGFVRPVRRSYIHLPCGAVTTMGQVLAETYARDPSFYGATYCTRCKKHLSVDEFVWDEPLPPTKTKVAYDALLAELPRVGS